MSRRRGLGDYWSGTQPVSSPHICWLCFVCAAADLGMYVVGVGREYVCVTHSVLWEAAQTTVRVAIYGEDGSLPRHLLKIPFESHSSLGFWVWQLIHCVYNKRCCMSSACFKVPRHLNEKCKWTWGWVLWKKMHLSWYSYLWRTIVLHWFSITLCHPENDFPTKVFLQRLAS